MTTLARTLQNVRPHIPMIRFPNRKADAAIVGAINTVQSSSAAPSSGASPAAAGSVESIEVPVRFQRRPISIEEMEYIQRGGPE